MNNAANDETRHLNASIERQQRILKAVKEELFASHEKLKQTLRQHDDIFYRLFPPVRPGRDPAIIGSRIEETRKDLSRLRQAIFDQRLELESLMQPTSTFESSAHINSPPRLPSSSSVLDTKDWEARVAEGRNNLANLKQEFADVRLTLDKLEALLSPIRMLPMEVIREIFTQCLEVSNYDCVASISIPLYLTHVCSSWRTIAINKPDLWTHISVVIENDDNKPGWPAIVKLWVERSKELPLSFRIQESDTHNHLKNPNSVFFCILDILTPQSHRWKSVELVNRNFQAVGEIEWFRKLPERREFPVLESLTLQTRKLDTKEATRITEMMRASPRLHTVTWMVKTALSMPFLPWGQLTHLTLIFISSLGEAQNIVRNSPLLQMLDISIQLLPAQSDLEGMTITHTNLRTVYLSCAGNLVPLFDSFTFPNVRDLTIDQILEAHTDQMDGAWPHDAFSAFLRRSRCVLQRFVLQNAFFVHEADLIALLRYLSPSLRTLEIDNSDHTCVTDQVLRELTYPEMTADISSGAESENSCAAVLCPKLEQLKLWGCIGSTDGVLADMVESRWKWPGNHPSLQRLSKGEFSAPSPPDRPLDRTRLTQLNSLKITYNVFDIY